jgi:hypothetical protein
MRKLVFGLLLALGATALLFPATAQAADTVGDEASFVAKINDLRAGKGLPALVVNANLVAKARSWSAGMAAAGRIWHSTLSDGITEEWKKLGENVGMGGSVDGLHTAFVNSPHHYENLVDPSFGYVGIGIVMNGDTIYVTESFMQLMPPKAPPVISLPPITTPTTARPATTTTTAPRPKPVVPKAVTAAAKPPVAPTTTTSTTTTTTTAPPVAATPTAPPAPEVSAAPVEVPRAPSALLVSVLERLRTFDS